MAYRLDKDAVCEICDWYCDESAQCRLNAPLVVDGYAYWPRVEKDDWCSRWQCDWISLKGMWDDAANE